MHKFSLLFLFLFSIGIPSANNALQNASREIQGVSTRARALFSKEHARITAARRALTTGQANTVRPFFSLEHGKAAQQEYYAKLVALPWGKLAQHHINRLNNQDIMLQKKFFEIVLLTERDWQWSLEKAIAEAQSDEKTTVRWMVEYAKKNGFITDDLRQSIDKVLQQCCIDPTYINAAWLHPLNTFLSGPVFQASSQTIFIPKAELTQNQKNLEQILSHEAMHIMHHDTIYSSARNIVSEKLNGFREGTSSYERHQQAEDQVAQHKRLQEERADILASLVNPEYALQGYLMHQGYVEKGYIGGSTHPSFRERAQYHKELHDEMMRAHRHLS